jgi:4-hydroxy-3-methylbut-2-enyl diphosphate reductase
VAARDKIAFVTQTTLSVDDTAEVIAVLKKKFPRIEGPGLNDICYATQNRQNAVRELATQVDMLLVVGANNSSNSRRLQELGEQCGLPSYLIQDESGLQAEWFRRDISVGITAGASAPEALVGRVIERLKGFGAKNIRSIDGVTENTVFKLPQDLLDAAVELELKKA